MLPAAPAADAGRPPVPAARSPSRRCPGVPASAGCELTAADGTDYWLEYRSATGQDAWLGTPADRLGLQPGVLLHRSGSLPDTSLLLDGTPSAAAGWRADLQDALPVGDPCLACRRLHGHRHHDDRRGGVDHGGHDADHRRDDRRRRDDDAWLPDGGLPQPPAGRRPDRSPRAGRLRA